MNTEVEHKVHLTPIELERSFEILDTLLRMNIISWESAKYALAEKCDLNEDEAEFAYERWMN